MTYKDKNRKLTIFCAFVIHCHLPAFSISHFYVFLWHAVTHFLQRDVTFAFFVLRTQFLRANLGKYVQNILCTPKKLPAPTPETSASFLAAVNVKLSNTGQAQVVQNSRENAERNFVISVCRMAVTIGFDQQFCSCV